MIILDSDHLTVLRYRDSPRSRKLSARLEAATDLPIATSIANVEETMKGWLSALAKERELERQISPYRELAELFSFFAGFAIALFDAKAVDIFKQCRKAGVRIATMDLKTASIAVAQNALLLTANRRDFEKVPGLRFENWLE